MSTDEIRKAQNVDEMISMFIRNIPDIEKTGKVQYDYLLNLFSKDGVIKLPRGLPINHNEYKTMMLETFGYIIGSLDSWYADDVSALVEISKNRGNRHAIVISFVMAIRAMINTLNSSSTETTTTNEQKQYTGNLDEIYDALTDNELINAVCARMRKIDPTWDEKDDRNLRKAYTGIVKQPINYC